MSTDFDIDRELGLDRPPLGDPQDLVREHFAAGTDYEHQQMLEVAAELVARDAEALQLYEPTEIQEQFHASRAKEVLLQAGNRFGKSLAGFAEDARAATEQDPHGKYPVGEGGTIVVIGWDEEHIANVIYRYLFMPGAFYVIRDEDTGDWRSWKPWEERDRERQAERKPAPPLIPKRFVKKIAFLKAGRHIFRRADLHNGWEIKAYSSKGSPAQGFDADLVHLDEDIALDDWYDEMMARLTMRRGKMRWTAVPQSKNDAMVNVTDRAEDEEAAARKARRKGEVKEPSTVCIRASIFDNPYMPPEEREENIKRWAAKGDDEVRKRAYGELTISSVLMYPTFNKVLHGAVRFGEPRSEVHRILAERNGDPPDDWMRVVWIDPGHTVCGATFWATPPPSLGSFRVVYDEIHIRNATAIMFGEEMEQKLNRGRPQAIQRFGIDMHGGAHTSGVSGVSLAEAYSRELEKRGLNSVETGFRFKAGVDDREGRANLLRQWLAINESGYPTMLVVMGNCPNLVRSMTRFKRKVVGGIITDEGVRRGDVHLAETAEYAAADGLEYVAPAPPAPPESHVDRVVRADKEWDRWRRNRHRRPGASPTISLAARGAD